MLPLLGEQEFGLSSKTAIISFIVSFGVTKAVMNLVAARLVGPDRAQADPGGGLGRGAAGSLPHHLGARVVVDRPRQRAARRQPGAGVVDDRDHEDRPGGPEAPRARPRPQRVRGLLRGGRDVVGHGLHRGHYGLAAAAVLPGHRDRGRRAPALRLRDSRDARARRASRRRAPAAARGRPRSRTHLLRDERWAT